MRMCVDQDVPWPAGIGNLSRETPVAFARSSVRGVETAIAFAGEKRAFLVCFSGAVVMAVSTVAVQGRAVVFSVSCGPSSVLASVVWVVVGEHVPGAVGVSVCELFRACCDKRRDSDGFSSKRAVV